MPSSSCAKCSEGILPPHNAQTLAALDDPQIVENADDLFCTCETGQGLRQLHAYRAQSLRGFLAQTATAQAAARAANQARLLHDAGIPRIYADADLETIAALIASRNDTLKRHTLDACRVLVAEGPSNDLTTKPGLYLHGPSGTLKTSLATAVYRAWTLRGHAGIWMDFGDTLNRIKAGYDAHDGSSHRIIQQLQEIPLLLWDDFGNDGRQTITEHTHQIVHDVIYARHAHWRPTLLTSNQGPEALKNMLDAPVDRRLRQMVNIVACKGQSYGC